MATSVNLKCTLADEKTEGLRAHVCGEKLTSNLKHKHHHVYFDNFFTSVHLLEDGIYGCGTARKDRKGFPPFEGEVNMLHSLRLVLVYCTLKVHDNPPSPNSCIL